MARHLICKAVAAALLAGLAGTGAQARDVVIKVSQGALRGVSADGVDAFKGIPYAKAPMGTLRWRPPEPAGAWNGVRNAATPGAVCIQSAMVAQGPQSEDCLFVNVWRPAGARPGARLPVMVWIHGGGYLGGAGSQPSTDGAALARGKVVVVTLNYRLGRLGFFAHPALTAENPSGPLGNYGIMDQIAALKWVRANIAAFGGNPANVTIFGESSGGVSVHTLMVSPLAHGLFAKAISESGLKRQASIPIRGTAARTGETIGLAAAAALGITGTDAAALAALRAIPAEKFAAGSLYDVSAGAYVDGVVMPEPVEAAFAAGHEARVPFLAGINSCEFCIAELRDNPEAMLGRAGPLRDAVVAAYGGVPSDAAMDFARDYYMMAPLLVLARQHERHGQPAWVYQFAHVPAALRTTRRGALHAEEIPYVFGSLANAATAEDRAVSQGMMRYWRNFAQGADPASAQGVRWPRLGGEKQTVLVFRPEGPTIVPAFEARRLDLVEQTVALGRQAAPRIGAN